MAESGLFIYQISLYKFLFVTRTRATKTSAWMAAFALEAVAALNGR